MGAQLNPEALYGRNTNTPAEATGRDILGDTLDERDIDVDAHTALHV